MRAFGVEPPTDDGDGADVVDVRAALAGRRARSSSATAVVGQMLDPATPAFRIGDLSTLWLTVHAFERDAVRIQQRRRRAAVVSRRCRARTSTGSVTLVGRQVERESRTVPVRIDVQQPRQPAAARACPRRRRCRSATSGAPILAVPVAAVQRVRNEWCVFLPKDAEPLRDSPDRPRPRSRRRGRGAVRASRAGETIVVDGAFLLKAQAEKGDGGHDDH